MKLFKRKIGKSNELKKIKKNKEPKKSFSMVARNILPLAMFKEEFGDCRGSNILYYKLSTLGIEFKNCDDDIKSILPCAVGNVSILPDGIIIGSMFDFYILITKCEKEFISNFVIQVCLEMLKTIDINFVAQYIDNSIVSYEMISQYSNICHPKLEKYLQVPVILSNEMLYQKCIERCNCTIYTDKCKDIAIMNLSDYIECSNIQIDYIKSLYKINLNMTSINDNEYVDTINDYDEILEEKEIE